MRILFYTPLNTRCRDIESQAQEFRKAGHEIVLLTQAPYGGLHENFKSYGYEVYAHDVQSKFVKWAVLRKLLYLAYFCRRRKIDIVYSHLEPANFIAVLAQYLIPSRVIICRHHVDEAKLYPFGKDLSYRLTYKLAREIIVVSSHAKEYMIAEESVPAEKIHKVNLAYNFDFYDRPVSKEVQQVRAKLSADVILLSVCRLTKFKRPEMSIGVLERLLDKGVDAKLAILGRGELLEKMSELVVSKGLEDRAFLCGYVGNVIDYMAAADFLVHPSLLESSCISVKEAGLVELPVIVCKGIGDFDEVIDHGSNGFVVDPDHFVEKAADIIIQYKDQKEALERIGKNLKKYVLENFEIREVAKYYEKTFHST